MAIMLPSDELFYTPRGNVMWQCIVSSVPRCLTLLPMRRSVLSSLSSPVMSPSLSMAASLTRTRTQSVSPCPLSSTLLSLSGLQVCSLLSPGVRELISLSLSSLMIVSLSHKPSQHSAHKISRLENLFYFCLLTSDMRLGWQLSRTEDNRVPEPQGSSFTWSVSWSRVNINDNPNLDFWSLHLYQDKLNAVITVWKLMMIICTHVLRALAIANHDQGWCDNCWADWRLAISLPGCHDPAVWQWPGESWDQTGPSVAIMARPVKGKRCENKS